MYQTKRFDPEAATNGATLSTPSNHKSVKRKAADSSSSSSSSSSSDSDSDSPAPVARKSLPPAPKQVTPKLAPTPAKKKPMSSSSSSSSSSSDSDSDAPAPPRKSVAAKPAPTPSKKKAASSSSSSSSSSDSSSDSDASPKKKSKPTPTPAPAPIFKPVSEVMTQQYGFMLPSGLPPTAESLAKEAAERQAMLDEVERMRQDSLKKPTTAPKKGVDVAAVQVKLQTISAKQAANLSKVTKLNAAQAAKLDAKELEEYRAARAEEKRQKKLLRRAGLTAEEKAALKQQAKLEKQQAASKAKEAKTKPSTSTADSAVEAPESKPAKKPPPPPAPVVPSSSAATNPALRSEGLRKKDESVRAAERAERKRARRIAMGLPPEEEEKTYEPKSIVDGGADATNSSSASAAPLDQTAILSHKRKLDDMREARMAAVQEREDNHPVRRAFLDAKAAQAAKAAAAAAATPAPTAEITTVVTPAPSAAPTPSSNEVTAALQAKPLWMVRGRQINPLSSVAVEDFALDERIKTVLTKRMGIERFFAAQSELLPVILKSYGTNDICCCVPTGSGKTLTYILPLIQSLSTRVITRLRGLILVPSRDLALQVQKVILPFTQAVGLKVECILGQSSFASEQERLVGRDIISGKPISLVDILIATPGRLMDHLSAAELSRTSDQPGGDYGFHLQDLQYLILDEIDRLLSQGYQEWCKKILTHVFQSTSSTSKEHVDDLKDDGAQLSRSSDSVYLDETKEELAFETRSIRRKGMRSSQDSGLSSDAHMPLQKLLFSATLTNNPQKLFELQLHNPLFFTESTSARRKFQLSLNLKQWVLNISDTAQKPLILIHLLRTLQEQLEKRRLKGVAPMETDDAPAEPKQSNTNQVLIFTSSIESTHRLYRLLESYEWNSSTPISVAEFSSALTQTQRNNILKKFNKGECNIIVCSDAMARGMDLNNVDTVINYDVPTYIQTYVHRVGRTARAGQKGEAYTLVKAVQWRNFKSLLHQAENSFYSIFPVVTDVALSPLMIPYQQGLANLKLILQLEKVGDQQPHMPLKDAIRARVIANTAATASSTTTIDETINADLEDVTAATDNKTATDSATPMEVDQPNKKKAQKTSNDSKQTPTSSSSANGTHIERPKSKKVKL